MAKSKPMSTMASEDAKWKAESDLRTLMDAEALKKNPKRYAAARAMAKEKLLGLAAVASESDGE